MYGPRHAGRDFSLGVVTGGPEEVATDAWHEPAIDLHVRNGAEQAAIQSASGHGLPTRTTDALTLYLRDVRRLPLLTREQEILLASRIELGDADAKDELVRANLRLVLFVARRYVNRGLCLSDLVQEGNLGLIRAAEKYDHRRGVKFSVYAAWWIRAGVTRAVSDQGRTIRISSRTGEVIGKLIRAQRKLRQELQREPTCEETALALGVRPEKAREILTLLPEPVSLDAPIRQDDELVVGDLIEDSSLPDTPDLVHETLQTEWLRQGLGVLSARERRALSLRFGLGGSLPRTYKEIGADIGVSGEYVRKIEEKALAKLAALQEAVDPGTGVDAAAVLTKLVC